MELPANLIEAYRATLAVGAGLAPDSEKDLYARHSAELDRLIQLVVTGASLSAVFDLLSQERRAFGWSFLSGAHGERVEQAFNALLSALESEAPNNSFKPKPLRGSA